MYAESTIIFPFSTHSAFCALQSRPHEIWARFFGPPLEDRLRYTPSDCFKTFPFPENWEPYPALEATGKAYYDFRAALMVRNDEGMARRFPPVSSRTHEALEPVVSPSFVRAVHTL